MGYKPYLQIDQHLDDSPGIFLEIGSERGEGSTEYFSQLARKYSTRFITVDLDQRTTDVEFYSMPGSRFAQDILPNLDIKIKCLYLDNMDWNWRLPDIPQYVEDQINWYKHHDIELTNLASQVEHLTQMIYILPYMAEHSVVVCDDTFKTQEQVYSGKCGAVVPFLLANGYKVVQDQLGVILKR